jgi:hypothetical protein
MTTTGLSRVLGVAIFQLITSSAWSSSVVDGEQNAPAIQEMREVPYQLTADRLKKMLQVFAAIRKLESTRPPRGTSFTVELRNREITEGGNRLEDDLDIKQVLDRLNWTGADFLWTLTTTGKALLVMVSPETSGRAVPRVVGVVYLSFLLNLPTDLRDAFNAWRAAEMDPALNELRP